MPSNMVYCENTTKSHHLSNSHKDCLLSFNEMIQKESKNKKCTVFDDSCVVLDLDAVEAKIAQHESRNRNSTCDCTVGVKENDVKKMLLIECRLNYENVNGITEGDLDAKVRGSKNLMGQDPAVLKMVYFVFKDKLKQQAFSKLRRMKSNRKEYIAITIKELQKAISA